MIKIAEEHVRLTNSLPLPSRDVSGIKHLCAGNDRLVHFHRLKKTVVYVLGENDEKRKNGRFLPSVDGDSVDLLTS